MTINISAGEESATVSLVIAVICTDGIVVSGDFRRSKSITNPKTGAKQVIEFYDDTHKLIKTKSNRVVGHTGDYYLNGGESIDDTIWNALQLTTMLNSPIDSEFAYLVSAIGYNKNALIEAGIINGQKMVLTWNQGEPIKRIIAKGCAIGDIDVFEKYKEGFEREIQNITTKESVPLLQRYNKLIANETPTISPDCEVMIIE